MRPGSSHAVDYTSVCVEKATYRASGVERVGDGIYIGCVETLEHLQVALGCIMNTSTTWHQAVNFVYGVLLDC